MGFQNPPPQPPGARAFTSWSNWTDSEQVTANQQGVLTPRQIQDMERRGFTSRIKGIGCFLMIGGSLFACASLLVLLEAVRQQLETRHLIYFLLFCLLLLVLYAVALPFVAHKRAAMERFRQQVAAGAYRIETVLGEIIWHQDQYMARTQQALIPTWGRLPPGPYQLYYTNSFAQVEKKLNYFLLSAQPIHGATPPAPAPGMFGAPGLSGDEQARQTLQQALGLTLHFTPEDLEANRRGALTEQQLRKLPRKRARKLAANPVGWVQSLMGEIKMRRSSGGEGDTDYYYEIEGRRFEVPSSAQKAWIAGIRYQVYYLPQTSTLLSVEPLEAPHR